MVNDFLFELGCEELPSGAVLPLANALAQNIVSSLDKAQISYANVKAYATPRRLAVYISDLEEEQPPQKVVRRGPAISAAYDAQGEPTPALKGFAKSCGVEISELTATKTDKGEWLVYEATTLGVKTQELLPALVQQAIAALPIAKPMRWGDGDVEFARPVHWAVMLFGEDIIPAEILGVQTGRKSYGHRFHAPQAIQIDNPAHYEALLQDAYVVADFAKRRALIVEQVEKAAKEHDACALMPDALVDEVTSIVEWPAALVATFERDFLDVPAQALIASMQAHQKCFALEDKNKKLLPYFITVTNLQSNKPAQVIAGNEKVMRARLSDAAFFFAQDKKQPLSHHIAMTANVVFQVRLGTLLEKATRVQNMMSHLAAPLVLNVRHAMRAAELSKCDLMTGMVGEFPELQGLMGYYYALNDGEALEVAHALQEQYLPRFAGDELPASTLGLALSLADRIDTLVGIFAIGQKPTGDKDPFKLRRHALAVVRLLVNNPASLTLSQLITEAASGYGTKLPGALEALDDLSSFIFERLQSYYQAQGIPQDIVQAVKARQSDWLYDFDKRVRALAEFVSLPQAEALAAACKRVNNLLQHKEGGFESSTIDEALLQENAEKMLFNAIVKMEQTVQPLYEKGDYAALLTELSALKEPVDAFFEGVMVMVEEKAIKMNRLALLSRLQTLLQGTADISLLQAN
ncbi:MAG: glycine--tRNA ligase subunit beta [Legionella sp.]|nr:glycine--tRNA ligase subunit beta [Legionella sp.]